MVKACGDYVVVEPIYEKESKGGILLAETLVKREGEFHGRVISVGPDYPFPEYVKKGSKVLFRRHEGTEIETSDGVKLLALKAEWILALIEEST